MNYTSRLTKLKKMLKEQELDAALISSVPNIIYFTSYSGFSTEERDAYLLISATDQLIITSPLYSEAVRRDVPHFQLLERTAKKPTKNLLQEYFQKSGLKTLGIEEDNLTASEYKQFKKLLQRTSTLKNIDLESLREIKENEEIKYIKYACKIGDDAFEYILGKIKPGISELELAWQLEKYIREHSAECSFRTIVAFGKNSSVPHHQTGNTKLKDKPSQIILLDFGVRYKNYCSDMTRTVFFGKATNDQKKMYEAVRIGQEKAIEILNTKYQILDTKLTAHDIDSAARDYIEQQGFPSIPHSVGHGIGLEVHELPHISPGFKTTIEPGMVFSVEPGVYIPGTGGIRIEDLVAVTKSGVELLTNSPKSLIEL